LRDRPGAADGRRESAVFGHDAIDHYGEARVAVGLAPQDLNLDWFLTLEETLDYHGGYFGMPRKERRERSRELLEAFSLTPRRTSARARCRAA
jgi:ABC-2 type transport system ATP-binding protein